MQRTADRRAIRPSRDAPILVAALLALALASGCMSPERRYRVLSFLFDGVPAPGAVAPEEPATAAAARKKRTTPARSRPRAPLFVRHEPDELCWDCHDSEDFEGDVVHGPFAAGECTGCHSPHKSRFDYLLLSKGSAICARVSPRVRP